MAHAVNETTENLRQLAADLVSIQFQSMEEYEVDLCLTELKSTHQSYTIKNIEDYINLVRKTLYADQFTIDLLSKYYNLPIYVFEPNSSEFGFRCKQTYLPEQTPNLDLKEPLFVLHVLGDHFHLLDPLPNYTPTNIVNSLTSEGIIKTRGADSSSIMQSREAKNSSLKTGSSLLEKPINSGFTHEVKGRNSDFVPSFMADIKEIKQSEKILNSQKIHDIEEIALAQQEVDNYCKNAAKAERSGNAAKHNSIINFLFKTCRMSSVFFGNDCFWDMKKNKKP